MIRGVLASEWLKICTFRSVRQVLCMLAAVVVLAAFLGWRAAEGWEHAGPAGAHGERFRMVSLVLPVMQLCMGALGALSIATEHASGMMRVSLLAVPRRSFFFACKAGVILLLAVLVGSLVMTVTQLSSAGILLGRPVPVSQGILAFDMPMFLSGLSSAGSIALVGFGLGAVTRSTAAALVVLTALLFAQPVIAGYLPAPWSGWLTSTALSNLPGQVVGVADHVGTLSPCEAGLTLLLYMTLALVSGAAATIRSDM